MCSLYTKKDIYCIEKSLKIFHIFLENLLYLYHATLLHTESVRISRQQWHSDIL
nr:MAG TPA_asm: hypothetical protein [Caudoviricetes sp.]